MSCSILLILIDWNIGYILIGMVQAQSYAISKIFAPPERDCFALW